MPPESETGQGTELGALAPLRAEPARAAILTDVDGTLAPIVDRPEQAAVPRRASEALERLSGRYALVGCISGRRAEEARRLVGVDGIAYAGNHGFELLLPNSPESRPAPELGPHGREAAGFAARLDPGELDRAGLRVEDKGPIVALHWRGAADEGAAEQLAERIAAAAEGQGLVIHRGRKVLELRPAGEVNKGTAIESLLLGTGATAALYAGDDRTDLDAFSALDRLAAAGRLRTAVRIGVTSAEGPAEIAARADVTVDGPAGLVQLLAALSD